MYVNLQTRERWMDVMTLRVDSVATCGGEGAAGGLDEGGGFGVRLNVLHTHTHDSNIRMSSVCSIL